MIPLTTLYNGNIDRPKLSEQKNPVEYIVPPPLKWVGRIIKECKAAMLRQAILEKRLRDIPTHLRNESGISIRTVKAGDKLLVQEFSANCFLEFPSPTSDKQI